MKKVNALNHSLSTLKGIGPAMEDRLNQLGIYSLFDLLFHLPFRYEDRTRVIPIATLNNGQSAVIEAEVEHCRIQLGKKRSLVVSINDGSGSINLRFFHFSGTQKNNFVSGKKIRCYGDVSLTKSGLTMIHPEYTFTLNELEESDSLTAIYPSTEGINQARWRQFIEQAFKKINPEDLDYLIFTSEIKADDLLSQSLVTSQKIDTETSLYQTLHTLHFPPATINLNAFSEGTHPYQRRLAFEELVAHRLSHLAIKSKAKIENAVPIKVKIEQEKQFINNLPFKLTHAQQKVLSTIIEDLEQPKAMMRLVQGDVGSGKTVVAALAMLHVVYNQQQVAFMVPTEILATQHVIQLEKWFSPLGISVELLVSKTPIKQKNIVSKKIQNGEIAIVVGTHALIQESIQFKNLALAVIDEQHRFGVEQRLALKHKRNDGLTPHQLVMTATPIPRTLAMTFYADLDYSVIDELPPGRKPVNTVAISQGRRNEVIERVKNACAQKKQVYWVCTLVEESEILECQAAESTAEELSQLLTDIKVDLIHGRMKPAEKENVMQAFKTGNINLLVATTVIEVGVDVPNASLMIIENPERLGLAQLHQLRGRVGRGTQESHCVLMYQTPLSNNGKRRLDIMRETNDGFVIAEEDLKLRGPGEMLGTRQSGAVSMRLANLERDADMIELVVNVSNKINQTDSNRTKKLIQRWCPLAPRYQNV